MPPDQPANRDLASAMTGDDSDPRDTKSWTTHNIPKDVWMAADQWEKLEPISTGGGFDYVSRSFGGNNIAIIVSGGDAGSPTSLDDTAEVHFYLTEDWTEGWRISFRNASEAIEWLGSTTIDPIS